MKCEAVSDREWSRKFKRYSPMWIEFEAPLKMLESGKRIKIEAGKDPDKRRKNFQEYAKRAGIRVASAISTDRRWIYFCRKDDGWRNFAQERRKLHGC